jgi:3D (Asp-Asp-Asp) domain-containing protein
MLQPSVKGKVLKLALALHHTVAPHAVGVTQQVVSTAYCDHATASGRPGGDGVVAKNDVPFGTRYRILTGSLAGKVVTVLDRYGHGTQFDIWMPCSRTASYGRQTIQIERL